MNLDIKYLKSHNSKPFFLNSQMAKKVFLWNVKQEFYKFFVILGYKMKVGWLNYLSKNIFFWVFDRFYWIVDVMLRFFNLNEVERRVRLQTKTFFDHFLKLPYIFFCKGIYRKIFLLLVFSEFFYSIWSLFHGILSFPF